MFYNEKSYGILDGWWTDGGISGSLLRANQPVAEKKRQKAGYP